MTVKFFISLLLLLTSWSLTSVVEARSFCGPKNKSANLEKLVQEADVIVVGQVLTIDQLEETTYLENGFNIEGYRHHARFHIDRVIHTPSELQMKDRLEFDYFRSSIPNQFHRIGEGELGMYFFQLKPDGVLTVANPRYVFIPALPLLPEEIEQKLSQAQHPFEKVQIELLALLVHSTQTEPRKDALDLLQQVENPEINATCHSLLKKAEGPLYQWLLHTLIWREDLSVLEAAVTSVLRPISNEEHGYVTGRLCGAIRSKVNDINLLPIILPLLESPDVTPREAGYFAIREMQNKRCIPYLLQAVRDPDKQIRFHGALGLSVMTEQYKWYPGGDDWVNNDRKITDYWIAWGEKYLRRKKKEPDHSPLLDSF